MVYIILGNGFEEIEAIAPGDILRRGGVKVSYVAANDESIVKGAHDISIFTDCGVSELKPVRGDMIIIPGGMGGVESIISSKNAMSFILTASDNGAFLAAICAGPAVLAQLNLLKGKSITCFPGCEHMMSGAFCYSDKSVVADAGLITGRAPGSALDFGLALLTHIVGEEASEKIRAGLVY